MKRRIEDEEEEIEDEEEEICPQMTQLDADGKR